MLGKYLLIFNFFYFFFLNRILCYSLGFQLQSQTHSVAMAFSPSSQVATQLRKDSKDSYPVSLVWHVPQIIMNA